MSNTEADSSLNLDGDDVRNAFETSFFTYFGRGPEDALFDEPAEFWLKRRPDGRYEYTRIADAWTGWQAAARRYAHIETLFRASKLGHEQATAECARLHTHIAGYAARQPAGWRPVSDPPPLVDGWSANLRTVSDDVLCCFGEDGQCDVGYLDTEEGQWYDALTHEEWNTTPTHWMPLPAPPAPDAATVMASSDSEGHRQAIADHEAESAPQEPAAPVEPPDALADLAVLRVQASSAGKGSMSTSITLSAEN